MLGQLRLIAVDGVADRHKGHKEQHQVGLHLPQLLYFVAFTSVMLLPALFAGGSLKTIRGALETGLGSSKSVLVRHLERVY